MTDLEDNFASFGFSLVALVDILAPNTDLPFCRQRASVKRRHICVAGTMMTIRNGTKGFQLVDPTKPHDGVVAVVTRGRKRRRTWS